MKKLLCFWLQIFIFCAVAIAQDSVGNNFVSLMAGPSFPVGAFASTDVHKLNSGMAKNGFTTGVKYCHRFDEILGFTFNFLYGRYAIKKPFNENNVAGIKPGNIMPSWLARWSAEQ